MYTTVQGEESGAQRPLRWWIDLLQVNKRRAAAAELADSML